MSSTSRTVLVTGATGNTGSATIKSLAASHPSITIRALVRDKAKAASKLSAFPTVQVFEADGSKPNDALNAAFAGVDVVVAILGAEGRDTVTANYIAASKSGGVKHAVVLSVAVAGKENHVFGRQFGTVESLWKGSGINTTIGRLPLFIDNEWGNVNPIKHTSSIYYPARGDSKFAYIAVADVGIAFASIASSPEKHVNQLYRLNGPDLLTNNKLAQLYTEILGKEVKYVQVPDEAAIDAITKAGYPKWQAEGIIELWHGIDAGDEVGTVLYGDFHKVTGTTGTSAKQWIQQVAGAFK